ncbi:MAG TPA: ABC transporter substrate-binding protein [Patescibacteria group bacterium]|nr:ABC transporter substrate-binding protein [Patescibacteria group bacterium]
MGQDAGQYRKQGRWLAGAKLGRMPNIGLLYISTGIRSRVLKNVLRGFLCCLVLLFAAGAASAAESIVLQLKWRHQFQFAGYYAAQELGYYREAGLDVQINEAFPGLNPVNEVLSGRAQYGVGNSELLLRRHQRDPVVVLAVIMQHSPLVLLSVENNDIYSLHDLAGKSLMLEPGSAELLAYLRHEGLAINEMEIVDHSYSIGDLISGRVEAMSAYATTEPFDLERRGVRYLTFSPRAAGIDFYGDNLFTTEKEIKEHPERVKAFRRASLLGWYYALEHPDEVVDMIQRRYAPARDRAALLFEASRMHQLIQPHLVELGYMHSGRWQHIAETYAEIGMLPPGMEIKEFLYEPEPGVNQKELILLRKYAVIGVAALLLIFAGVMLSNLRVKRQYQARRQAEDQLRAVMENMDQAVLMYDNNKQIVAYNGKFLDYINKDRRTGLEGQPMDALMMQWAAEHGLNSEVGQALCARLRYPSSFVAEMPLSDGRVLEFRHNPVPHSGFVRTYTDITARKTLENELRGREMQLRTLLDGMPNAVTIARVDDGLFLYANDRARELVGVSHQEIEGSSTVDFWLNPAEREKMKALLRQKGTVNDLRVCFKRLDGSIFWVSINARMLYFEGAAAVFAAFTDIDERNRIEKQLLEYESQFRSLLEIAPIAVAVNGTDGTVLFINDSAVHLLQMAEGQALIGTRTDYGMGAADREMILQRLAAEGQVKGLEVEISSKFRKNFWALISCRKIEFAGQQAVMTVMVDISDRKRAEAVLRQSHEELEDKARERARELAELGQELSKAQELLLQQEKLAELGKLVASVTHEVNTPIGIGVMTASGLEVEAKKLMRLFEERTLTRADFAEFAEVLMESTGLIQSNLQRAAELIRNFKQVAVDQIIDERRLFNLREYLDGVVLSLRPALKKTRHQMEIRCRDDVMIESYPGMLAQIVINLATNSLLHAYGPGEAGHILIAAEVTGDTKRELLLEYRDDGSGMQDSVRERIFEPFFTTRRGSGGTGLGLHIIRTLVIDKLKGSIACDSLPGQGTTFRIRIPLAPD